MGRVIEAFKQFLDGEGDPLVNGWLKFLEAGSNNTLKDTFYDSQYQGRNENPLRLDAEGRCPDVFGRGNYRVVSFKNDPADESNPGEQVQVKDPVQAAVDSIAVGGGGGFQSWSNVETYQLLDIVTYSGVYYRSLIADNINNTPPLEPFAWEEIEFLEIWNETITYNEGDLARYEENLFFSSSGSNINNRPDVNPVYWRRIDTEMVGVSVKTDDYSILIGDRDFLLVLGNTTTADKTFTLPIVDATYSGFRVWLCNASDYELTVEPGLGNDIWFDSTNDIKIQKGAHLELRYCSNQNRWMSLNNVGPVLGGQDIGTDTLPVESIFANNLLIETISITTSLSLGSDVNLYFGDTNQVQLYLDSGTGTFLFTAEDKITIESSLSEIELITGTNFSIDATGSIFLNAGTTAELQAAGVITLDSGSDIRMESTDHLYIFMGANLMWDFQQDGKLVPGAPNTAAFLGTASNPIDEMHMGTGARIYFGDSDFMRISHDGVNAYFANNTGNMYFYNGAGVDLSFYIDPSKDCHAYQNFYVRADRKVFFDEGDETFIYYNSSDDSLIFGTEGTEHWEIDSTGYIMPKGTKNIGSSLTPVNAIFGDIVVGVDALQSPNINAPSGSPLDIGIYGGATITRYIRLTDYVSSGSNMEIRFTWNSASYKLTATPA